MKSNEFPEHKCGLYLEHNTNRDNYDSVAKWVEHSELADCPPDWESGEHRQRAIDTNELWTLCWYPNTPVGNYFIAAPTLEELLAFAAAYTTSQGSQCSQEKNDGR